MWHCVERFKCTKVSEGCTASIFKAEGKQHKAGGKSQRGTLVNFVLEGIISQKAVTFKVTAVGT
jgi:hypothetical protein